MSDEITQNEQQQLIERLLRDGSGVTENAFVTSAGGRIIGFAAKVISKSSYNHYNIQAVEINPAGVYPTVIGTAVIAVNLAESFTAQGTLTADTYVIMFKVGEYYCFCAPV